MNEFKENDPNIDLSFKGFSIKSMYKLIADAISGGEREYTSGSIKYAILMLSIPMVLEMIMESVFAVVDIFFVSKIGPDAVATVGISESLVTIVYAIAIGLGTATTAIVSRRIGEKDKKSASEAAMQAILTGFFASIPIAIAGIFYSKEILSLMGASDRIVNEYHMYPAIVLGSNVVIMMLFIINSVFRSAGDAALSMRVLFVANLLNIILDPILIFGWGPIPELGVAGAAIATSIGRGCAVAFQFLLLFKGKGKIKLELSGFRLDFKLIKKIIKLSVGSIGQYLIATSSWIGLMRIVSYFGSEVVAGYTIAIRIIIFILLPSFGMSNAAATLTGQNLGAGKPERAVKSVWITGKYNMILLGAMSLIFIIWPDVFISLFISDSNVIEAGANSLRIISYGFIAYALGMVLVNSINGAGDTITPTIINFFCFWVIEIPLAYLLAIYLGFGENGAFSAIVIAETVMTFGALWVFLRGKWKNKKV